MVDISPATLGNNTLGFNDGHGYTLNPVTGQPYASNIVLRGDFTRSLTEFWADGPTSETPPGHWNSIANHVSDDMTVFRIGGTGPEVDRLEWDVKLYFTLNAAVFDAGCAAWSVKRHYNGWRPISAIRYCGGLGQSSDPGLPSYHTNGLPLVANLIELVTDATVASVVTLAYAGKIAVFCWPGQPADPANEVSGVKWASRGRLDDLPEEDVRNAGFPRVHLRSQHFQPRGAEALTGITAPGGFHTAWALTPSRRSRTKPAPPNLSLFNGHPTMMRRTRSASRESGVESIRHATISRAAWSGRRSARPRGHWLANSSMAQC
jgi:hypothetical protein